MSRRLPEGGRLIDRSRTLVFRFDGERRLGFAGDTVASALLAENRMLMGRSFKYHRPRGPVTAGPEEPNALVGIGEGKTFLPNARATATPLTQGLEVVSQNRWPRLDFDLGSVAALLSRFLPAGFYYKTFLWPRAFWKHLYEPAIRASAGLGRPPRHRDADSYEHMHAHVDLLIAGGGIAGLAAARRAAEAGARVLLMEQGPAWGGRVADAPPIDGMPAADWVAREVAALAAMPNLRMRLSSTVTGVYDHGWATALETCGGEGPRERLWKIRARAILAATGAIERPLAFAGNDVPGVMLASAMRDYVTDYGVLAAERVVVVTNNDDAYRTALVLREAGAEVTVADVRDGPGPLAEQARAAGARVLTSTAVAGVAGGRRVGGVMLCRPEGDGGAVERVEADGVAMSGGWSPAVHLWSHAGGKLNWDETQAMFRPDPERPPRGADGEAMVFMAGAANGAMGAGQALRDAARAADAALEALDREAGTGLPEVEPEETAPIAPVWVMPARAPYEMRAKAFLDFQNDVKVTDIELAHREGFRSVEHAKRYTTLGMATDQGKLSNVNGLAVLAMERGDPIAAVGTTTFRPPFVPVTFGAIAGEARGPLFQPVRRTPLHDWHAERGAKWEPVGHWRRPYAYPGDGPVAEAVAAEVTAVREGVGILDASTLGKLLVSGPDAGRFLDMLYTGVMSSLAVGRCRYGLMCNENGFLIDDGVVARLDERTWLCHTTTGGADRIHAHMEEWLQTEWWDWRVHVVNQTEHYAQIGLAGPRARDVLAGLTDADISREALPFMRFVEARVADVPARIFRISFSGELSYEIAVPANAARGVWDALLAAGEAHGIRPYGTEALHVLRAEKGFIMIGDETDGTVIPQDLGLDWAISKKKDDYLGKRAQQREHMTHPLRWRLVGLETPDGAVLPEGAYLVEPADGDAPRERNANGQIATIGRVTSTYWSPTLGRGIALALVERGPDRMGDLLEVPVDGRQPMQARIVSPVFLDPEGTRQDV